MIKVNADIEMGTCDDEHGNSYDHDYSNVWVSDNGCEYKMIAKKDDYYLIAF